MLHAKTATIDFVWSCVGSTNLDWRSFLHNDELDATILGREFAFDLRLKERAGGPGRYWL